MLSIGVIRSVLLPIFDADTGVLFLSGKGDGLMRTYEICDSEPILNPLMDYKVYTAHNSRS